MIDAQKLCTRLISECSEALVMPDCVKSFGVLRVTSACIATLDAATCNDLAGATPSVASVCFPPCSGILASCNADGTITLCTAAGTSKVADCQASCVADGFSKWNGVCGTTNGDEIVDQAQCWCE